MNNKIILILLGLIAVATLSMVSISLSLNTENAALKEEISAQTAARNTEWQGILDTPTPTPTPELNHIDYAWSISNGKNGGGGQDISDFIFENTGAVTLYDIKIKFDYYTANGRFYTTRKFEIGTVEVGKKKTSTIKTPSRYWGYETWTTQKLSISYNGLPYKDEPMELIKEAIQS